MKAAVTFRKRLLLAGFLSGAVLVIAPVAIELLFYSGSLSPEASLVEILGILAAGGLLGGGAGYVVVEVFHWVWPSQRRLSKELRTRQSKEVPARVKQAIPFETMPIKAYASSVRDVEMPTAEQIENFANYVSHTHSWYKHLPLFSPGKIFCCCLDEYAACDVVEPQNGVAKIVKRTEPGFHYSDLPTEEFRTRFGCLGLVAWLGRVSY